MRKVILGVAVSLDGFIEGPHGEYDWCFTDQDYGMKDFLKRIDTVLYGRKSFEMAGGNVFPDKKAYVFSNKLNQAEGAVVLKGDVTTALAKLKAEPGKDMWLFGGAELTTSLLNGQQVDELWLAVHPILLGKGKLLFQGLPGRIHTRLISQKAYSSGLVSLSYEVKYHHQT